MDTNQIIQSVIIGGGATVIGTEILKNPYIPVPAKDHPRATAAVVSLIASIVAIAEAGIQLANVGDWASALTIFGGVLMVSASAYHNILKVEQQA